MRNIIFTFIVIAWSTLVACSKDITPTVYGSSDVGVVTTVKPGIVVSKRAIKIDRNKDSQDSQTKTPSAFHKEGFEYIVQMEDGSIISVVQDEKIKFKKNQKVFVIYGGSVTRIVADNT